MEIMGNIGGNDSITEIIDRIGRDERIMEIWMRITIRMHVLAYRNLFYT